MILDDFMIKMKREKKIIIIIFGAIKYGGAYTLYAPSWIKFSP